MKENVLIHCVPLRNNIGIYKAVNFIVGYFPHNVAGGFKYRLQVENNIVQLLIENLSGETSVVNMLPAREVTYPGVIYLANIYGDLEGFFVNSSLIKPEKVEVLELKSMVGLRLDSYVARNDRQSWFNIFELEILKCANNGLITNKVFDNCIYRLRVMNLSGMDYPRSQPIDAQWCVEFAKVPDTTKSKIGAIIRHFAWQAGLKVPKENLSIKLHYGIFPLPSASRSIHPLQVEYLNTFLLPE